MTKAYLEEEPLSPRVGFFGRLEMVWIIQCLCPQRHAIYGIAYDPKNISHDTVRAGFQQLIEQWIEEKTINPWCGICSSRVWTYEQKQTKFQTMEEARTELRQLEVDNIISRIVIDQRKAEKN